MKLELDRAQGRNTKQRRLSIPAGWLGGTTQVRDYGSHLHWTACARVSFLTAAVLEQQQNQPLNTTTINTLKTLVENPMGPVQLRVEAL